MGVPLLSVRMLIGRLCVLVRFVRSRVWIVGVPVRGLGMQVRAVRVLVRGMRVVVGGLRVLLWALGMSI